MKAIVLNGHGIRDALTCREVDRPTIEENEVLVAVHAAGLDVGDYTKEDFTMARS